MYIVYSSLRHYITFPTSFNTKKNNMELHFKCTLYDDCKGNKALECERI